MTYTLEFYASDGESVREGEFTDLQEALERWWNIGSRWYFYHIGVIFTEKGMVKVAPDVLQPLEGSYRKKFETVVKEIEL